MAPITQKTITHIDDKGQYKASVAPQSVDYSKVCIGDYMLSDKKSPKEDFLRQRLEEVKTHNDPIKEEIAACKVQIKESQSELSLLKRLFKKSDDFTEQATLKEQISALKSEQWNLIRSNCRRAWSLMHV